MYNNIAEKKYLDQYFIPNTNISIKEIYNTLYNDTFSPQQEIYPKTFHLGNIDLILQKKDTFFYYLELSIFRFKILLTPIHVKFLIDDKYIIFDLFSEFQFTSLINELNLKNPQIIYRLNNKILKSICTFSNYIQLYKCSQNIYINNIMEYKIMSEDMFNSIKIRKQSTLLDMTFFSPKDFDKNFYLYFPNYIGKEDSFQVLYSPERENIANNFLSSDSLNLKKYFGRKSIGKSITLIGALKYMCDHTWFNTLYINCETIDYYSTQDHYICKQILIDEISYLFSGDYSNYCMAVNEIKKFNINSNDRNQNFWSLLLRIFNYITSKYINEYYIAFDHYNSRIDPFNQLNDIKNKKNEMKDLLITLMTVSSLNEDDIKQHKAKSLFTENELDFFILYVEINNFFDKKSLNFNDENIDNKLEYIGRNIENFINITSYINKGKDPEEYLTIKKNYIKNNVYKFFGINENINLTPQNNMINFLSFSVNSKYSINEFKKIFNIIPFEYFDYNQDIIIVNNDDYFDLNYAYPVIKDIFEEIYSDIILSKTFDNILNNNVLDGGSKGDLFEKMVIKNFTPGQYNNYSFNFFEEFIVTKIYSVPKFVPKEKETVLLKGNNIIIIEKKPFLLKQKIFGGKAFDIVIVKYFGEYATFFCFQITGHKKKADLMTLEQLINNIKKMIKYMKNFFNFDINAVYFSYIFDHEKIWENKVIRMCENLDKNNIKYIFYDKNTHLYYNHNGNLINKITQDMNEFKFIDDKKIENGKYKLNERQIEEINKILKNMYKTEEVSFNIFHTDFLNMNNLIQFNIFCIKEFKCFNNKKETFMIFMENGKFKIIILHKDGNSTNYDSSFPISFFSDEYDYYKIIIN